LGPPFFFLTGLDVEGEQTTTGRLPLYRVVIRLDPITTLQSRFLAPISPFLGRFRSYQ
jgi:hypothetical protein